MIDISYKTHPELFFDYRKCLNFLKSVDNSRFEYPEERVNFHIYTEVRNDKELECIKSFLATQNLEKTNLIVWSDYDITNNELIQPYLKYLDLRVWNVEEEAKGTILENSKHIKSKDEKYYLQSDLLRILALHKYGGVWVDTDIIFIKDFLPLLDQEYMYQWGSETDFGTQGACATVLSLFKNSEFSQKLMRKLLDSQILPNSTVWGKDMFASLWSEWPNFTIFPSPFFNTEWLVSKTEPDFRKLISHGFDKIETDKDFLFLDAFAWHWHNSSNKHREIKVDSKFDLLRKITNNKLKEKGII